ncbi:MAG: aminotransferase class V-fold PLP-dependent enzyme [Bacteroidota bacterium]
MKTRSRRNFLRAGLLGLAGLPILSEARQKDLFQSWEQLGKSLSTKEDEAYWEEISDQFSFEDGFTYFNTGSLGPCPKFIVKATNGFRATLDGFPSKYMWGGWQEEKEKVRTKVAQLMKADEEEIALIHNTTEGMNLIASSMDLKKGDEVILCDHEHMSAVAPWRFHQESKGIKLVRPKLPILPESKEELVEVFRKAITKKTKVISVVHLTNTNGMILPIKEISEMAHEKGILVAVDGAQSSCSIDFGLQDLGCDFYANSAHKWLFSPKGMGIFYAKKKAQKLLTPMIVARGYKDKSIRRFENYNTRNLPEYLGVGAAVDYRNEIGHERIVGRHYELKRYFRDKVSNIEGLKLKSPAADDLSGPIQAVEVLGKDVWKVKRALAEEYKIDCRPMSTHGLNALRISLSLCTSKKDVDYLLKALEEQTA